MRLLLLLAAVLIPAVMAEKNCSTFLECFNDSVCKESNATFSNFTTINGETLDMHKELSRNGYHCACKEGWTGLRCKTKYESCIKSKNNEDTRHKCYNGGKCIPGLYDMYDNKQLYCDCSAATGIVNNTNATFVGQYCEIPSVTHDGDDDHNQTHPTEACNPDRTIFCVNGATCKKDYEKYPGTPCNCPPKYDGPHCEFFKGSVPNCTLTCKNQGICRLGIRTYRLNEDQYLKDFFINHTNYQYCDCPAPYYGSKCEVKTETCGDFDCFNSGTCVTHLSRSGHKNSTCDCTTAKTKTKSYGGRFCQYESNEFCDTKLTTNGKLFCLNGGTCSTNKTFHNCSCPSGFHGPTCEFKNTEQKIDDYEECTLTCKNGGICRNGAKDTDFLDKFGPSLAHLNISYNSDFEHCVCPEGYIGLTCEHKVKVCEDGTTACFHGSECINEEGSTSTCNCQAGYEGFNMLAGKYCQHKSTSICTESGTPGISFAFCVNDGKCKANITDPKSENPGCTCPNRWAGSHCEFLKGEELATVPKTASKATDGGGGGSGMRGFGLFLIIVASFALTGGFLYSLMLKRKRAAAMKDLNANIAPNSGISLYSSPYATNNSPSDIVLDLGPATDLDGNVLHNVEII